MFTPNRQLTRTPPPSEKPPIAGTPLTTQPDKDLNTQTKDPVTQPNKTPSAQLEKALPDKAPITQPVSDLAPSTNITAIPQKATPKTPLDNAMNALEIALTHVGEAYQKTMTSLNQDEDRSHVSVETPLYTFEEIGRKLTQAKEYLQQHKADPTGLGEYFKHLEQTLKKTITTIIKETITTITTQTPEGTTGNATRTYASIAETSIPEDNQVREIQRKNLERKMQRRREENKLNVILTTQNADPDTKEKLAQQSHAEIAAKLQQTIESQIKENPPTIPGIQKLKSSDIRIHCETEKAANDLRNIKWEEHYKGLSVRQPKYGLVIPGVSTEMINPNNLQDPELIKHLEDQNKGIELKILEMKILQRKLENNARSFSLVIFVPQPDMANKGIKHGIYYNYERFITVEKYTPQLQLIQCYKCTQLGHHASKCRSLHHTCAKCSEHHPTSECQSETHKCALCKGEHQAWTKNCPTKIKARQNLTNRKRESPPYFDE